MRLKYNIFKPVYIFFIFFSFSFVIFFNACYRIEESNIFLTQEEKEWLKEHEGKIRIGYTTDYKPIEFLKNGEYVGITADYFKLLEKKLGIKIEMVQYDEWPQLLQDAKDKKISGITAATKTYARVEYLNFTVPYIFNPNVIITRKNFSEKLTFEKLNNSSMEIVALKGYSVLDRIKLNYPDLQYRTVLTAKEGLRMISFGEADAMIIQLISATVAINEDNITNLIVNTETIYDSNLSIATRNDWPILNDIFNKGLAQITESERNEIKAKWIPIHKTSFYEQPFFWFASIGIFITLAIILIAVFIWNITLKKKVEEKTAELERSKEVLFFKSYHDELTEVYNRAYYNEQLKNFTDNPQLPFSTIIADLNGLKITNDTLGHEAGDNLIKAVANILKKVCRDNDIISRIGGDEFVILMPLTNNIEARLIIDDIKKECQKVTDTAIPPSLALGCSTLTNSQENINTIFKKAEDIMYENKIHESSKNYENIITSLKEQLEKNTFETSEHCSRLKKMALMIGKQLALSNEELNHLKRLAELHDIGQISIPIEILNKASNLTNAEKNKIERHPDIGFKIASSAKLFEIADGILYHHEHWDGSGYPSGLKGESIPVISRIIAVVDAYDAMTTGRPYKKPISKEEAIRELQKFSGKQFDPNIVNVFINYLKK